MKSALSWATLAGLVFSFAACSDHDHVTCPTDAPSITSFTLTPDTVTAGGDMNAVVAVANFELTGEAGHSHDDDHGDSHTEAIGPGADTLDSEEDVACAGGHVHVYLDDLMTNPLTQAVNSEFILTIPADTAVGAHTVMGRLHNRDHTILEPQVITEVAITVE